MPLAATAARPDGGSRVTFATTPRMSTYLLAVVAGPLVSVAFPTPVGRGAIPVKGWAVDRANNVYKLGYATDACAAIIPFYESLYDLAFPLPKMDMIAIPDFAAGAMENFGLVTYRETAMLANTTTSSASELQRVAVVVAHELAHQWCAFRRTRVPRPAHP
jgi:aminopeptidase N